jgi:hypothetical protein
MKRLYLLRLAVVVLTIGLVLGGCDNGSTSKNVLDGTTWESSAQEEVAGTEYIITGTLKFDSPDFEWRWSYTPEAGTENFPALMKGTYTVSSNVVTLSLEGGVEMNATISGNSITFPGGEGEDDIIYTKK